MTLAGISPYPRAFCFFFTIPEFTETFVPKLLFSSSLL